MNKKKFALIVLILIYISILSVRFQPPPKDINISKDVVEAYLATCKIVSDGEYGQKYTSTGVLLNTGYIITAAHCVDVNFNSIIDPNEQHPEVTFYGSVAGIHTANTIYIGEVDDFDVAILQIDNPPKSNVSLEDTRFGDEVFTIGMTLGEPSNISVGRISSYSKKQARASISAWKGNSGGGIWTTNQALTGIVSRIGTARQRRIMNITVPTKDGNMLIRGSFVVAFPLSNWLWYTDAKEIRNGLDKNNLTFVYKKPKSMFLELICDVYLRTMFQVFGVLFFVSLFRRYLFS